MRNASSPRLVSLLQRSYLQLALALTLAAITSVAVAQNQSFHTGSITAVDQQTVALAGSAKGVLVRMNRYQQVTDANDSVQFEATFTVEQVVGSDLAVELITGE